MISDEDIRSWAAALSEEEPLKEALTELLSLRKLINHEDEVLVALKRIDGYEDAAPELVAEDALLSPEIWPEWRVVKFDDE